MLCANPELRVFGAYWQAFLICFTEIRVGFPCLMYSEEAEVNTKTMYVCSFDILIVSLHAAFGDVLISILFCSPVNHILRNQVSGVLCPLCV